MHLDQGTESAFHLSGYQGAVLARTADQDRAVSVHFPLKGHQLDQRVGIDSETFLNDAGHDIEDTKSTVSTSTEDDLRA